MQKKVQTVDHCCHVGDDKVLHLKTTIEFDKMGFLVLKPWGPPFFLIVDCPNMNGVILSIIILHFLQMECKIMTW